MPALLKFDMKEVQKLVEMARAAKSFSPTFSELMEAKYAKPGTKPDAHGFFEGKDIDGSKIPASLHLVKDAGIYLMSAAADQEKTASGKLPVVYAEGFGEDADYSTLRAAVGGDDFVETIPLDWFDASLSNSETHLMIFMSEQQMGLQLTERGPAPAKAQPDPTPPNRPKRR